MQIITRFTEKIHLPLFVWAENHGSEPWPIRRLAAHHHVSLRMAACIAEITGIGGNNHE